MIEKFNKTQKVIIVIYIAMFFFLTVIYVPWEYDITHPLTKEIVHKTGTYPIFYNASDISWSVNVPVRNAKVDTQRLTINLFILTTFFGLLVFITGGKKKSGSE